MVARQVGTMKVRSLVVAIIQCGGWLYPHQEQAGGSPVVGR
jgi:hypothetical protein